MLASKKIDVYRRRGKVVLQVANGPAGWAAAIWSYCPKIGKFELNVSLHSHGLTSLGSVSIGMEESTVEVRGVDLQHLVQAPRSIHWHPSGERIVVIESGKVFIFAVAWVSKVRRNNNEIQVSRITMKRASEITCDHYEEEDNAEREEIGTVAGAEVIGVKISLRQSSININATAMVISCSAFQDLGFSNTAASAATTTAQSGGTNKESVSAHQAVHGSHSSRVLVGTDSGAVLSLSWGWDDESESRDLTPGRSAQHYLDHSLHTTSTLSVSNHEQYQDSDLEEEGRRRAHSVTAAGRLLATVVQPALSSADEHRDILRLWKGSKYALQQCNATGQDMLPEIIDIGNITEVHYGDSSLPGGNSRMSHLVDVDLSNDALDSANSISSGHHHAVSAYAASAVRELHFNDRTRVMVCLYGDGSFTTALLVPCVVTIPADASKLPVMTQPPSTVTQRAAPVPGQVHTFQVLRSAKVHPVALVAYPLISPLPAAGPSTGARQSSGAGTQPQQGSAPYPAPSLYEMGAAGVYRSVDSVSSHDIENILDLSPSLLHKVTRMRKLVSSKAEEEISRVVCLKVVDDGENHTAVLQNTASAGVTLSGGFKIVVIMHTKHLPTLAPSGADASTAGSAGATTSASSAGSEANSTATNDRLIGRRLESTSMAVFEVSLLHRPSHPTSGTQLNQHPGTDPSDSATAAAHGYELHCVCTQAVGLKTGSFGAFSAGSPRPGVEPGAAPSMELIHLPQQSAGTHVLVVESSGAVVCRPLDNLRAVLFTVNTLGATPSPSCCAHLVTATAAAGRLVLTVWDSAEVAAKAPTLPLPAPGRDVQVSDSTRDLLKLSLFNPVSSTVRTPGTKVVLVPLLVSPAVKALPGQSSCMFVDLNEGALHYVDAEAAQHSSVGASPSGSEGSQGRIFFSAEESLQEYHTSLSSQQLKLPKRLLSDVLQYQQLCAVGNPFQPRRGYRFLQEGLLVASSKQCRVENFNATVSAAKGHKAKFDFARSSLTSIEDAAGAIRLSSAADAAVVQVSPEYLAFVAGGSTVPYKQQSAASKQPVGAPTQAAEPVRRQTPLLWVYNRTTHRWRSTYLIVGNKESRACLVKDIPTAQSPRTADFSALSVLDARAGLVEGLKDLSTGAATLASQSLEEKPTRSKSDEPVPVGSPSRNGKLLPARIEAAAAAPVKKDTGAVNNFGAEYTFSEALKSRPGADSLTTKPAAADVATQKGNKRRHSANEVIGPSPTSSPDRSAVKVAAAAKSPEKAASATFSMQSLFSGPRWGSVASGGNSSGGSLAAPADSAPVQKRCTSVPITGRSHMSGGTHAILSVAWYGTHTLVLLTLRRSTYCIELLSREASKASMNTGKLQPAVHKIIMLPPGYSPSSLEAISVTCKEGRGAQGARAAGCPPVRSSSMKLFARQPGNDTIAEGNESASEADSAMSDSSDEDSFDQAPRFGMRKDNSTGTLDSPGKLSNTGLKAGSQDGGNGGDKTSTVAKGLAGCVVVVSDGCTLLSYHIQVEGELKPDPRSTTASVGKSPGPAGGAQNGANKRTLSYPQSLLVQDYAVTALWDTTLSALAVREDFCQTFEQQNPDCAGISFPLKETKVFIQSTPLQEHQQEGFQRLSHLLHGSRHSSSTATATAIGAIQPVFPVVSLVVLDAQSKVWYVDADLKECTLLSAGPVSRLSALHPHSVFGAAAPLPRALVTTGGETPGSVLSPRSDGQHPLLASKPLLGQCFILHVDEDPSAEAQRKLLQIFQKTSLIQHLRPSGWRMVDRLALPDSALWVPVAWAVGRNKRPRGTDLASPVHAFGDADVLQPRKHKRLLHTAVTVPLPTLPPCAQSLGMTAGGVLVGLDAGCVDVSAGSSALSNRHDRPDSAAHTSVQPSLLHVPLLSALFCTCLDSRAGFVEVVWEKENAEETSPLSEEHNEKIAHMFAQWLLHRIRASHSCTALLIDHLEQLVKVWAESKGFTHKHDGYNQLTSFLFNHDPTLMCELISRLGRKLEPSVSRHLFPVHLATEEGVMPASEAPRGLLMPPAEPEEPVRHSASVIRLYESALSVRHLHHAARTLSLACEAVGGSEDHISTAASLVLALELLHLSARTISLRNVMECLEFCLRLENMLIMHSRGIFGNPEGRAESKDAGTGGHHNHVHGPERSLDSSYINTVKNRAMLLISSRRDAGTVPRRRKTDQQKAREGEPFTPLTAASPALPYYLGMGVGWIINKAVQNLALPTASPPPVGVGAKTAAKATTSASGGASQQGKISTGFSLNKLTLDTTRSRCNSADTHRGSTLSLCNTPSEHLRQVLWQSTGTNGNGNAPVTGDTYSYRVIESIESQFGALAISQMLSRTTNHAFRAPLSAPASVSDLLPPPAPPAAVSTEISPPSRARRLSESSAAPSAEPCRHSLTMLLLVQVMKDLFKSSSHYCNAAALMASLLQSQAAVEMIRGYIMSTVAKNLSPAECTVIGAAPQEKVRRILYVFRLNKSLVRGVDADALLKQRISAQYLRRIIEADVIHGAHGTVYSESPRAPTSPGQSASTHGSAVGTGAGMDLGHRNVEYFELTEELLVHPARAPQRAAASADAGAGAGNQKVDTVVHASAAEGRHLTLLELLKALAVGMLLVGDIASAGALLTTLCPHLKRLDRMLHESLVTLPAPSVPPAPMPAVSAASMATTGINNSDSSSNVNLVWKISAEQLQAVLCALSS